MNQLAEVLGVILLLPVRLQTRGGVVACSTTLKAEDNMLCAEQHLETGFEILPLVLSV